MDDSCEEMMAEGEYYARQYEKECFNSYSYSKPKKRTGKRIGIVCSESQYKQIKKQAFENGMTMSDYILAKVFGVEE